MKDQRRIIPIQLILNLGLLPFLLYPLYQVIQSNHSPVEINANMVHLIIYLITISFTLLFNIKNTIFINKHLKKRITINILFISVIAINILIFALITNSYFVYLYLITFLFINISCLLIYTNKINNKVLNLIITKVNQKYLLELIIIITVLVVTIITFNSIFVGNRFNSLQTKYNNLVLQSNLQCDSIIQKTTLYREYSAAIENIELHHLYTTIPRPTCNKNLKLNQNHNYDYYETLQTEYNVLNEQFTENQEVEQELITKLEIAARELEKIIIYRNILSIDDIKAASDIQIANYIKNTLKNKGYTVTNKKYNAIWLEKNTHVRVYYTLTISLNNYAYTDVIIIDHPIIVYDDKFYENGPSKINSTFETTYENAIYWFQKEPSNIQLR